MKFVSIVIPVYNGAKMLEDCIRLINAEIEAYLNQNYEIIIAEDASSDGTTEIAEKLAKNDQRIVHLHSPVKQGRGKALSKAFHKAKGDIIIYLDVDLDISPKHIPIFVEYLKNEYDIVLASKRHPDSKVNSPILRKILSITYNKMIRFLFKSKIYCHQGGMKGFKKESILKILPFVKNNKWFWDTEVLIVAQWMKYKLKEIPITCDYGFVGTTVNSFRDAYDMFLEAMKFKKGEKILKKKITEKSSINLLQD